MQTEILKFLKESHLNSGNSSPVKDILKAISLYLEGEYVSSVEILEQILQQQKQQQEIVTIIADLYLGLNYENIEPFQVLKYRNKQKSIKFYEKSYNLIKNTEKLQKQNINIVQTIKSIIFVKLSYFELALQQKNRYLEEIDSKLQLQQEISQQQTELFSSVQKQYIEQFVFEKKNNISQQQYQQLQDIEEKYQYCIYLFKQYNEKKDKKFLKRVLRLLKDIYSQYNNNKNENTLNSVQFRIGYCYQAMEQNDRALVYYDKCLEENEDFPEVYFNQAILMTKMEGYGNQVIQKYERCIQLNMKNIDDVYCNMGCYYVKTKKYDKAVQEFELSYGVRKNSSVLYNWALSYRKKGDKSKEIEKFTQIFIDFPKYLDADTDSIEKSFPLLKNKNILSTVRNLAKISIKKDFFNKKLKIQSQLLFNSKLSCKLFRKEIIDEISEYLSSHK